MKTNKTSKSTNKTTESSAASLNEQIITDSKPVKRTTKSSAAAQTPSPKAASHRHSITTVHVSPVVEPTPTAKAAPTAPSPEDVAQLAYAYWVERNYAHGFAAEDWFRAEQALAVQ